MQNDVNVNELTFEMTKKLKFYLSKLVENHGSDLHIKTGANIRGRINGEIVAFSKEILSHTDGVTLAKELLRGRFVEFTDKKNIDFTFKLNEDYRFRVNMFFQVDGVSAVFRTIPMVLPTIEALDLPTVINSLCELSRGLVLVTGPTGSGKTTTLNAILTQRDRLHEIIYTIEDPIEYKIDFVTQFQVNEAIDFTFATAMKSVMRQDPDVIVIGEMRDKESIQIALKAAHSGHMVFSTLHTTNASMALERIRDEGGDLFILAYSLSGVIAQRLVLQLCDCKTQSMQESGKNYFKSEQNGFEKKGCIKCNFSGYNKRVLLTDVVLIPPDVKIRYDFYMALKNGSVTSVWDKLITFSYYESAKYLFDQGFCDYETLIAELLSLGFIDAH